jgi:hypothetical protein
MGVNRCIQTTAVLSFIMGVIHTIVGAAAASVAVTAGGSWWAGILLALSSIPALFPTNLCMVTTALIAR